MVCASEQKESKKFLWWDDSERIYVIRMVCAMEVCMYNTRTYDCKQEYWEMINWWKKNCMVFYDAYGTCSEKQRKYISKYAMSIYDTRRM